MSVLDTLVETRSALIAEADALVATGTAEALDSATAKLAEARSYDSRIETAKEIEARKAEITESRKEAGVTAFGGAVVTKETRTYDRDYRNSWAKDQMLAYVRNDAEARARLARHAQEADVEARAGSTTATSGGEFAPPAYLLEDYAPYARAVSVTSNLLTNVSVPDGTPTVKIPQITTGTLTALQLGNNASATTRDLVTAYVTSNVETAAGYNDVSIQLLEQSPVNMDAILFGDLAKDLALRINTQVTSNNAGTSNTLLGFNYQGVNNGTSVTWTETTPTATNFAIAMGKALSGIANNRYDSATGIVMHPSVWYYMSSLVDTNGRPLFATPNTAWNPLLVGDNVGKSAGLVGTYGGIPVYTDATIATTTSSQKAIIVAKFDDSYLFKGSQKAGIFPDVGSSTLTVRFRLYQYVALAHRFAKSSAVISGTGTAVQSGF